MMAHRLTVDDIRRREAIDAQCGDEGRCLPVSVRHLRHQALPAPRAPVVPDPLGRDRRLVDEHQARRVEARLLGSQLGARGSDVRPILLGGVQRFF